VSAVLRRLDVVNARRVPSEFDKWEEREERWERGEFAQSMFVKIICGIKQWEGIELSEETATAMRCFSLNCLTRPPQKICIP
jgi:hypothetical protein